MCRADPLHIKQSQNGERTIGIPILIVVQRDATQSCLFIVLQVHSTCFGCQLHSSSGVHKTVTTASKLAWTRLKEVAAQTI